ncbi:[Mytilus coruscus]|uniref:MAG n=1 Tax=Mytilus coruscus TaxID=42192 RepID=A0A6J8CCN8_MYTCO|nr:MAG [Mytilus coruscus]
MSKNQGTEIYAQGLILTKNLKDLNIDIIGDYSKSICNLIIRNVSDVDIGNYTCESWKSGLLYVHKFTLYLKSPPTNLTFLNTLATKDKKIIRGIDGQTLDIVCNVKSGRPEGTLLLTQNGSNVAMGGSSTLVYSFTPTKRDNMKLFKCSAFSEMLELPLTDEVTLDIQYKPLLVADYLADQEVIENTSLEVCCQGHSNPPISYLYWTGNFTPVVVNDTESCLTFKLIHRTNTGIYTCVASNSIGISNKSIEINVMYPPSVSVTQQFSGSNLNLHCNPEGNPKRYTFGKWYHRSEYNETIRTFKGTPEGNLIIVAPNITGTHENDGFYICRVSNGIADNYTNVYQEGAVLIQSTVPPIFVSTNQRVQYGQYERELNITVLLFNRSGNILLNISNHNQYLQPRITKERVDTQDVLHGVHVTVSAVKVVFYMGLATKEHFGNYTIEACNNEGCNTYIVYMRSGDLPQTPTNLTVINYENHMIVSWMSEFNGGFNQDFFIQYRTDDTELWTTIGPVKDNSEDKMKYPIYELVSTKQYCVRMFSRNIIGDSNKTNMAVARMFEYQLKTRAEYNYCSVIIGNIFGGMLICCIGSHIYWCLRRKSRYNATEEISPEGQYDEIGTLNYNSVIIDPITIFEQENNDNISNDDESNAVLSSVGGESSNESSFIGRPAVYTQNATVYASEGDNVIIKCKLFPNSKSTWDKVKSNEKSTVILYADGDEINPDLPNMQNLAIVGNINEGDYNLQIQNVSLNDDGIYICSQRSSEQGILEFYLTLKITEDDFKSTFAYGYCWIIMGSIVGGVVLSYVCSHIFCSLKRGKIVSEILHINPDDNYDEIGTLNDNNAIFDQIANDVNMNNDNVSSIIESSDDMLMADVVSSDDSSSIKQFGDGYENPYQAINHCNTDMHHYSNIVSCNYQNTITFPPSLSTNTSKNLNIAMDRDVAFNRTYTLIFVEKGENVVLNCTCSIHNESACSGPKISSVTKIDKNEDEPYTAGLMLKPKLHNLNVDVIGDYECDGCSLIVRNFSEIGVGNYICEYWKSGIVYIHNFTVHLKIPPNNLIFVITFGTRQHKLIRGIEGQKLNIVYTVNSGKPQETLILAENGSTVQSGGNGKIVYSFVPSKKDNMKLFECSVVSSALERQLTVEVILDSQYPPLVNVSYRITLQTINLHCHPESEPKNYTFAKWYFRSEFNETIRKPKRTKTGNLTIKAQSNKTLLEHVGIYVCRVSNGVIARNGNVYQEGAVYVQFEDRPELPNNITVVRYENHMIVSWIRGFNGGFNQDFFIQHQNGDTEWWTTTGPIKDSFENEIKNTIYELVSHKQYFVCMFSRNVIGDCEKTSVTEARIFEYELITLSAYNDCTMIIGTIVGGMLICCIVSHIYCCLRRQRRSNATLEITPESQYDEIGTMNYNMVIVDPITNFEIDNSDNVSNDDVSNGVLSSAGGDSSNASSFIGRHGDGYENAYQSFLTN